jgi:penicillin-binding protein 1C
MEAIAQAAQRNFGAGQQQSLALLVVENRSRLVLAHVGSGDYWKIRLDLTRARRSPGSTLKPFIYGLAFEQGFLHPETEIFDGPDRFGAYGPSNFDGTYQGWVSIREALQRSLNLPAVQVLERLGSQRLLARFAAVDVVVGDERNPGLSLALGGASSNLRDLVALYAALADQGLYRPLRFSPTEPEGPQKRLLSEGASWYVDDILRTGGNLSEREASLRYKTGTSYGFRDAWALGYTRQHTVGVWVGRPDGGYGNWTTGAEAAVPLLRQVFAVLQQGQGRQGREQLPPPPGLVQGRRSDLPPLLQRFNRFTQYQGEKPRIYFPVDGSTLHLGRNPILVLKAQGGTPPLYWLVNGRPLGREQSQIPASAGLHHITVLDSRGRQDKISVWVDLNEERP